MVGLNFHQTKEALAQDQSNGVNGKVADMQMMEPQYDSSCCEITTRGKTKALLQKNFLRMWRNVGWVIFGYCLISMCQTSRVSSIYWSQIDPTIFYNFAKLHETCTVSKRVECYEIINSIFFKLLLFLELCCSYLHCQWCKSFCSVSLLEEIRPGFIWPWSTRKWTGKRKSVRSTTTARWTCSRAGIWILCRRRLLCWWVSLGVVTRHRRRRYRVYPSRHHHHMTKSIYFYFFPGLLRDPRDGHRRRQSGRRVGSAVLHGELYRRIGRADGVGQRIRRRDAGPERSARVARHVQWV